MLRYPSLTAALAVTLLALVAGCSDDQPQAASSPSTPTPSVSTPTPPSPVQPKSPSPSVSPSASLQTDPFSDAVDAAESAATITQSAKSTDDWDLVASRWDNAIKLLKAVPNNSKNYATAQKKLVEYQAKLAYAAKKAGRPINGASSTSSTGAGTKPKSTSVASPTSIPADDTPLQLSPAASPKSSAKPTPSPQSTSSANPGAPTATPTPSPQSTSSANPGAPTATPTPSPQSTSSPTTNQSP